MIPKIILATAERQKLIQNIASDLHNQKPKGKYVDYFYTLKAEKRGASLTTDESENAFRRVSILHINYSNILFNGIEATIGNTTGNIASLKKPLFMSTKKALRKIDEFLRKLQPENLKKAKSIEKNPDNIESEVYSDIKEVADFESYKITKHFIGSDSGSRRESNQLYKTL